MIVDRGTKLGPYEILEPLGAGGMGEVYNDSSDPVFRLKQDSAHRVSRDAVNLQLVPGTGEAPAIPEALTKLNANPPTVAPRTPGVMSNTMLLPDLLINLLPRNPATKPRKIQAMRDTCVLHTIPLNFAGVRSPWWDGLPKSSYSLRAD
jgi:hypothetical protein